MRGITIARDPVDPIAAARPVTWLSTLALAFEARGMPVLNVDRSDLALAESPTVLVAGAGSPGVAALGANPASGPSGPESFAIVPIANDELGILLAAPTCEASSTRCSSSPIASSMQRILASPVGRSPGRAAGERGPQRDAAVLQRGRRQGLVPR